MANKEMDRLLELQQVYVELLEDLQELVQMKKDGIVLGGDCSYPCRFQKMKREIRILQGKINSLLDEVRI